MAYWVVVEKNTGEIRKPKSEIRVENPKLEIRNRKNPNDRNPNAEFPYALSRNIVIGNRTPLKTPFPWNIGYLVIVISFGFRISSFGFPAGFRISELLDRVSIFLK